MGSVQSEGERWRGEARQTQGTKASVNAAKYATAEWVSLSFSSSLKDLERVLSEHPRGSEVVHSLAQGTFGAV